MTERRLWLAVGSAALGGLLFAAGPLVGVAGADSPAGFASWPLLILLAMAPLAVAAVFVAGGRTVAASALLVVLAVIAVGRAVGDIQLLIAPDLVARPELLVPTTIAKQTAGTGAWLVLVGHVFTVLGGVLAWDSSTQRDNGEEPHRLLLAGAVLAGLVASIGFVMMPFSSGNPFLTAVGVLDSSALPLIGGLLVALAVPVAVAVAVSSGDSETAKGGLLGAAFGVLALVMPPLVAGLVVHDLHPTWGPYLAVLASVVLIGLGASTFGENRETDLTDGELPSQHRLHVTTGVLGILAAVTGLLGALLPAVTVPAGVVLDSSAGRPLGVASVLVGLLGVALLVRRWAAVVRPAFVVACAAIPFAAGAVLDSVLAATSIGTVESGIGVVFIGLALVFGVAAAVSAAVAGTAERDDADLSDLPVRTAVLVPVIAAVVLAIGAFGLATMSAADYQAPGIWSNVRLLGSSALVIGLLAVVAAATLSLKSRPVRAAGLLLGAAGLVTIRLLEYPLTSGRIVGATVGPGTWMALACVVALVTAAVLTRVRAAS